MNYAAAMMELHWHTFKDPENQVYICGSDLHKMKLALINANKNELHKSISPLKFVANALALTESAVKATWCYYNLVKLLEKHGWPND